MTALTPARRVALVGTLAVVAYAVLAGLQILVLNPLAAVPGRSLAEIEAELARWDESLGGPWIVGVLITAVLIAAGMLVGVWRERDPDARGWAMGYLALLVFGAPAYFYLSFGPGMALADTFGISGGDHAPWALPLFAVSAVAFVALVVLAVVPRRRVAVG